MATVECGKPLTRCCSKFWANLRAALVLLHVLQSVQESRIAENNACHGRWDYRSCLDRRRLVNTVIAREFLRCTFKGNNTLGCAVLIVVALMLAAVGYIAFIDIGFWIEGCGPGHPCAMP
jgi:hypothetical protein